jgi:hypothetical protein
VPKIPGRSEKFRTRNPKPETPANNLVDAIAFQRAQFITVDILIFGSAVNYFWMFSGPPKHVDGRMLLQFSLGTSHIAR